MSRTIFSAGALIFLAALVMGAADAQAQGATPVPLSKVILSDAAGKRAGNKAQINEETARAIVDACVAFAKANNASYAIYVLGPNAEPLQIHVMDGQLPIAVETAEWKAKTALYIRKPSGSLTERYNRPGGVQRFFQRAELGDSSGLAYYPVRGGLPIVVDGFRIGAIGVGGGHSVEPGGRVPSDEECAHHALETVLGPQPPLTQAQN
jgi:glc operon protein GlcG